MIKLPLLTILLFICAFASSQTQTEKETRTLLAHKWKPTHMEEAGQKMPAPAEAADWFLDIKADGNFIMLDAEGLKESKWSYDHRTKAFTVSNQVDPSDPWKFEIVKISETELVLRISEEGMTMKMYLKR